MSNKVARIVLWSLLGLVLMMAGTVIAADVISGKEQIAYGVVVSGIDIGGMYKSEASVLLRDNAISFSKRKITLKALDLRWKGIAADFGVQIKWQEALDKAYNIGRDGNILVKSISFLYPWGPDKIIDARVVVDKILIEKTLEKAAKVVNRPHKDASIKFISGSPIITPEIVGIKVDSDKAIQGLVEAITKKEDTYALPITTDKPDVIAADLNKIDTLLAGYTTSFKPSKVDRTHNLTLAAKALSGVVLKPGDVFSYNRIVGERAINRGYRNAIIFVNGKSEEGLGGGVCQVSTTLYNVVLLSDLEILERHHHSRTVTYVVAGRDATVAYGSRDFKFKNINSSSIWLYSQVNGNKLRVELYGNSKDKKNIKIYASLSGYRAAGVKTIVDKTLPAGRKKVDDKGSGGVSSVVYKRTTNANGTQKIEVVSRDKYNPQNKIILVGPEKTVPEAKKDISITTDVLHKQQDEVITVN